MARRKGSKNKVKSIEGAKVMAEVASEQKPVLEGNENSVRVAVDNTPIVASRQNCTNCLNHGNKVSLADDGTCSVCGFDKSKLYGAY